MCEGENRAEDCCSGFNSMNFQPIGYFPSASVIPDEGSFSCRDLVCLRLFFTALTVLILKCD